MDDKIIFDNSNKIDLEECHYCKLTSNSNKINKELEKYNNYLDIFEIIISSNSSKKLTEIIILLKRMVETGYIKKDIFNKFIRSKMLLYYSKKYLKEEQIDINDTETINLYKL